MVKFMKICWTTALFIAKLRAQMGDGYSNFNSLAKAGDLDEIRHVMENYESSADKANFINQGDHWDKTTIHYAAEHGHADVIRTLVGDFRGDLHAVDYRGRTALHLAGSKGNVDAINELIRLGDENFANAVDKEGKNALHYAAETGQHLALKSLINHGHLDVNSRDFAHKTPLMIAAERGHIDFVHLIVSKYNSDTTAQDHPTGMTALMYAAKIGHLPIVDLLKDTATTLDNHGRSAFHYAVISGQSGLVNYMMRSVFRVPKSNRDIMIDEMEFVRKADENGVTPLHLAAKHGHQNICELFLGDLSDMLYSTDVYGQTPLHMSVRLPETGFTEILEYHTPLPLGKYTCLDLMLKADRRTGDDNVHKATIPDIMNTKDRLGHTVLSRAVEYGCSTTLNRLFKKDVKPDIHQTIKVGKYDRMNMIHYAIYSNQLGTIDTLIRHGIDKTQKMSSGMTPLILAVKQGSLSATVKMLHYNKQGDAENNFLEMVDKNSQPRTALIWATIQGQVDILKSVIANGADINFNADNNHLTALHFAAAKGDDEVVKVLLHAGADYDAQDKNGITPLDTAIFYKKPAVLSSLLLQYQKDHGGSDEGVQLISGMFDRAIAFTQQHSHQEGYEEVRTILEDAAAKHYEEILDDFSAFEGEANDYSAESVYYSYYYDDSEGNMNDWMYLDVANYDDYTGTVEGNKKRKRRSARQH